MFKYCCRSKFEYKLSFIINNLLTETNETKVKEYKQ